MSAERSIISFSIPQDDKSSTPDSASQTTASKEIESSKENAASTTSDAEKGKEKEPLSLQDAIRLDAFNVLELLGPEKVYPKDVKLLKEKVSHNSLNE